MSRRKKQKNKTKAQAPTKQQRGRWLAAAVVVSTVAVFLIALTLRHPTNEPFFERAREMFDGKRQNVLRRLNTNPDAAWNKAVRDAVQRHGLRSHPDAVVIGLRRNVE